MTWPCVLLGGVGLLGLLSPLGTRAQAHVVPDSATTRPRLIDLDVTWKNMHLYRGFRSTSGALTAADVHYTSRSQQWRAELRGGAGFTGEYKEVDYYVSYTHGRFQLALWNLNNFSNYPAAHVFSYTRRTTAHLVDLIANYTLSQRWPLRVTWSTMLLGRDFYLTDDGRAAGTFSTYAQVDYQVWQQGAAAMKLVAGGAFGLIHQTNLYGSQPVFTNLGGIYSDTLRLGAYEVPVAATASWNPTAGYASLQGIPHAFLTAQRVAIS